MQTKSKYLRIRYSFITAYNVGIFAFFFFMTTQLFGFEPDTATVKVFPEVRVEANRILSGSSFKYSTYEKINKKQIKEIAPSQIGDVLNKYPGIFIKDYGGLGGIKTISIRGTSADHTIIMLNGIKLNSSQNSTLDLSKIPVSLIEDIEIMRGGNSAAFGGNALGGIINITTGNSDKLISSGYDFGSYGYNNFYLNISPDEIPVSAYINYQMSDGDYTYSKKSEGEMKDFTRNNADFENLSASVFYNRHDFKISTMGIVSNRGIPGAVLKGNPQSENARYDEYELLVNTSYSMFGINSIADISANHKSSYSHYYPNGENSFVINNEHNFTLNESTISGNYNKHFSNSEIQFNTGLSNSLLSGNMLQPDSDSKATRLSYSLSGIYDYYLLIDSISLSTQAGLRYDYINDAGSALSPLIGLLFEKSDLKVNFQYSYNFRPPSFNEMYYINYGNSDLLPERSHSFSLGMLYLLFDNLELKSSLFFINTNDKIVSVPKSPVSWTAENIGNVVNKGVEINAAYHSKIFSFSLAYTLQEAIDKTDNSLTNNKLIPYIPQELIAGSISAKYSGFNISTFVNYNSFTYSLPGNEIASVIPDHTTIDFNINKKITFNKNIFTLNFKIKNLLDEQFEIIKNYPMPQRQFYFGLQYEY